MSTHAERLRILLSSGPVSPRVLLEKLGTSQPTLSRALAVLGDDLVRIGSARSIQYALRDPSRGFASFPVYRIDPLGRLVRLGVLTPIRPEGFVMHQDDGKALYSEGLPWWLLDMRPQGFLGRAYAASHSTLLGLPTNVSEWSDTHALRALLGHGQDPAGNLLLGDVAREHFLNASLPPPVAPESKPHEYAQLARAAMLGDVATSSAGGEQPKFTVFADTPHGPRHLLVKFSLAPTHPVTTRWRDLLLAEHHALETLRGAGIAAAKSWVLDHGGQRFLEVERFDRAGATGRHAMHSLAALEGEFVGKPRAPWPVLVEELARQKVVDPAATQGTQRLFAFGRLIGNSDMHTGNLSFVGDTGRPYALAPAYDMLPMAFAPGSGGGMRDDLAPADLHPSVAHSVWRQMLGVARLYLDRLQADERFSAGFAPCLAALDQHLQLAADRVSRLG